MIDIDYPAVGTRIAKYRKMNGVTAAQLAAIAGPPLTREVLAKIESGRRTTLDVGALLSIAWALGVPPVALILPIDEPHRVVDVENGLHVREAVDWFTVWKGPPANELTPAGLAARQRVAWERVLVLREEDLASAVRMLEENLTSTIPGHVERLQAIVDSRAADLEMTKSSQAVAYAAPPHRAELSTQATTSDST